MKFPITDRTLMKMLFERGAVTEIAGVHKAGHDEYRWEVRLYTPTIFRDRVYYTGTVAGQYDAFEGDALDAVLDQLEAWLTGTTERRRRA